MSTLAAAGVLEFPPQEKGAVRSNWSTAATAMMEGQLAGSQTGHVRAGRELKLPDAATISVPCGGVGGLVYGDSSCQRHVDDLAVILESPSYALKDLGG
jgi:hypothetical protein